MIYVTSDTHWNHINIIKYCDRPFKDMDHMREGMIANWNSVVGPDDVIFHLGDFAMGRDLDIHVPAILNRLNGRKFLVAGNHDHPVKTCKQPQWESVQTQLTLKKDQVAEIVDDSSWDRDVVLRHYNAPKGETWDGESEGSLLLHGHSHGRVGHRNYQPRPFTMDCGVDRWNYHPIPLSQAILAALNEREDV